MLAIFDCDGVLVDSEPLSNRALAETLTALGLPTTTEQSIERYTGRSWSSCVALIEQRLGGPAPAELAPRYRARMRELFERGLRPVAGISAALDALAAPRCVASSGEHEKIRFTLGMCGLRSHFPDGRIFSATDVAHGKPAPDLFLHAAATLGHEPAECVVIEDSPLGVAAARAAGMRVLGYAERTPAAKLAEADAVFDSMAELPELLATSTSA